jgi:hypothetical protein
MHDQEKSDSAIVAEKPPNKTGSPVAEVVEPRAGTKGTADQQSTLRTQSRDRVNQALSRVRQAARQRKTGNLHVPGLHLHLRSIPPGQLPASTENSARPSAGEAAGYQGGAAAANAPADPNPGIMAEAGRDRPLRLLCSPDQCSSALCVPVLRDRSLAASATAAKPEGRLYVGPHDEIGRRLAPRTAHPSPLARPALRRQTPKVGAGCSNRARPDLCGGCSAMSIPTANLDPKRN